MGISPLYRLGFETEEEEASRCKEFTQGFMQRSGRTPAPTSTMRIISCCVVMPSHQILLCFELVLSKFLEEKKNNAFIQSHGRQHLFHVCTN